MMIILNFTNVHIEANNKSFYLYMKILFIKAIETVEKCRFFLKECGTKES